MAANDYYKSQPQQYSNYPQGQGGYFPQQPPNAYQGGYNGPPQQYGQYPQGGYGPTSPPQTVYVQQPAQQSSSSGGLMACLAGACLCCCAEELCVDCCF